MLPLSAIALFCSDVRAEKTNTDTLVGVFPENVDLPRVPLALPKVSLYVRLHLDPAAHHKPMKMRLINADSSEMSLGEIDTALIDDALNKARLEDRPYAGIIFRAEIQMFPVNQFGRISVVLSVGSEDYVCGTLMVKQSASPSASEPQLEQSPVAAPTTA